MKISLRKRDRRALRIAEVLADDPADSRRCLAVRAVADGVPVARVARAIGVSRPTVYHWVAIVGRDGAEGLLRLRPPVALGSNSRARTR